MSVVESNGGWTAMISAHRFQPGRPCRYVGQSLLHQRPAGAELLLGLKPIPPICPTPRRVFGDHRTASRAGEGRDMRSSSVARGEIFRGVCGKFRPDRQTKAGLRASSEGTTLGLVDTPTSSITHYASSCFSLINSLTFPSLSNEFNAILPGDVQPDV
jgi:hypothetical protein